MIRQWNHPYSCWLLPIRALTKSGWLFLLFLTLFCLSAKHAEAHIYGAVSIDHTGGSGYPNAQIQIQSVVPQNDGRDFFIDYTNSQGDYNEGGVGWRQYNVTLTVPPGYRAMTANPVTVTVPGPGGVEADFVITAQPTPTPTATPPPTPTPTPVSYSIAGNVFLDPDKDGTKTQGETNYPGAITITSTGGTVTTSQGAYTVSGLPAGSYTIAYANPPRGDTLIYPRPAAFYVTVGPSCSAPSSHGVLCINGNVTNLNFAISNTVPWIQLIDFDGRVDSGFTSAIPSTASPACGPYADVQDGSATTPGTIVSGDTTADFGTGAASTTGWVVGGSIYPEDFSESGQSLRTSYGSLLSTAVRAGLTTTDLSTLPSCSNLSTCSLPANLPDGIYQANSDLSLSAYSFPAGKNYVFLINGTLTIMGNLTVPVGSTALFSAAGNIQVDKSVKAAADTCPVPTGQLQGMFSADKNFIVEGINNCSQGNDTMLTIDGAVVVNAARGGGSFINDRDLCGDDSTYPSLTIRARADFLLNAPQLLAPSRTFSSEEEP